MAVTDARAEEVEKVSRLHYQTHKHTHKDHNHAYIEAVHHI